MSDDDKTYAWIRTSAEQLAIPLEPEWLPAVKMNIDVTFRLAKLVDEFALPDEAEAAPVFRA
jgi:hypothetical protein